MQMVADEVPRIFGENANWEAFDISRAVGRDLNFTIYNEDAVRLLISDAPDIVHIPALDNGKDLAWNHQHFTSALTQSILQGETLPQAAKRLSMVLGMDERAATRAARTAMTGAESAGRQHSMERAERMGIPLRKTWRAKLDGRTRQSHRELDGTSVSVSGYFVWGDVKAERPADPTCPAWFISNCRCTLGNEVDVEGIPPRVVRRTSKLPKGVSYDDWKAGTYRTNAAGEETKSSMVERGLIYG